MGYMAVFYNFFMIGTIGSAPVGCYMQDASTKDVGVFKMQIQELHKNALLVGDNNMQ